MDQAANLQVADEADLCLCIAKDRFHLVVPAYSYIHLGQADVERSLIGMFLFGFEKGFPTYQSLFDATETRMVLMH